MIQMKAIVRLGANLKWTFWWDIFKEYFIQSSASKSLHPERVLTSIIWPHILIRIAVDNLLICFYVHLFSCLSCYLSCLSFKSIHWIIAILWRYLGEEVWRARLHRNKVTNIQFSPREPWMVITTSVDNTVKVWDIR